MRPKPRDKLQHKHHSPAPFRCLLEGQDNTGQSFALSISALSLPSGATLGRSPANAEFIIDHESVSREHIRLCMLTGISMQRTWVARMYQSQWTFAQSARTGGVAKQ